MTKRELLENSTFGARVAEEESEDLSKYFVKTDQWKRLLAGDVDIIYGPKGSGKSALYSLLNQQYEDLRLKRRIVCIAAENPRGAPAFGDLIEDPPPTEEIFRQLWKFYFLSLLAEYVRHFLRTTNKTDNDAEDVFSVLAEAGLLAAEYVTNLKRVLKRVTDALKRKDIGVEGGFHFSESGTPEFVGKLSFNEPSVEQRKQGFISSDDAFEKLSGCLDRANITVWFMLDRLDVAFTENTILEQRALRALFRTYLDLIGYKRINLKIFLRDDIWRKITAEGFREASHITRTMTISWDAHSLLNLIVRRVLNNTAIVYFYNLSVDELVADIDKQKKLFYQIFPSQVAVGRRQSNTLDWMLSRVSDGYERPAPRELIHLLQLSRDNQLVSYQLGNPEPPENILIGRSAVKESLPQLSKTRFELTLCAEYPHLRTWFMKMENGKTAYTFKSLTQQLGVDENRATELVGQMVDTGFLLKKVEKGELVYWIPFIYRATLNLSQGAAESLE